MKKRNLEWLNPRWRERPARAQKYYDGLELIG